MHAGPHDDSSGGRPDSRSGLPSRSGSGNASRRGTGVAGLASAVQNAEKERHNNDELHEERLKVVSKWLNDAEAYVFNTKKSKPPTVIEIICKSAAMHVQCAEVNEQFLLITYHLCCTSYICKMIFLEMGAVDIVSRIKSMQIDNLYLSTLCELCEESLEVSDGY